MSEATLRISDDQGVTVVEFRESSILDALTIQQIGRDLYELVDSKEKKLVLLDFDDVRFLSSQALGVLLTLRRKADKAGAKVALCSIKPELVRIFQLTNLDKLFQFFDTKENAFIGLGKEAPAK
ncbi:MAG: STAS domain-containing protein [Phycisphaerae bacterium]